ncbi:hypothetical protein BX600DRAFT_469226 [Xylariales sp. PMI_506]|nr:hypothetical protein BX600DRAFT_469226 [Xylariales sp. PMI_506]
MRQYPGIWRKRYLIPCWLLQWICAGIFLIIGGLLAAAAAYVADNPDDESFTYNGYTYDQLLEYVAATGGLLITFGALTIFFGIIEVTLFVLDRLSPVLFIVFSALRTLFWSTFLLLAIVGAARGNSSVIDLVLSIILLLTSILQVFMGATNKHKLRTGKLDTMGHYKQANDVEAIGLNTFANEDPRGAVAAVRYDNAYAAPVTEPLYDGSMGYASERREDVGLETTLAHH